LSRTPWILALALLAPPDASARTWDVPGDAATIAAGIDSAAVGDTVLVACGTYLESGLVLRSGVTLRGAGGAPACVTIDGQGAGRVLDCAQPAPGTGLENIVVTGGAVSAGADAFARSGGGLRCDGGDLAVTDCAFRANAAQFGGGAAVRSADVTFTRCAFDSNAAAGTDWATGGGLHAVQGAPRLVECTFGANTATSVTLPGDGGAVFARGTDLVAADCAFTGNSSGAGAGAFYSYLGDRSVVERCTFTANTSLAGGALYVEQSFPLFRDCDFDGNVASNGGAAFLGELTDASFENCVFDSNAASPNAGGAVDCWHSKGTFTRCRFTGNTAGLGGGACSGNVDSESVFGDCLFDGNSAATGGAVRVAGGGQTSFGGCTLAGNAAPVGAGVFCDSVSAATLDRTLVAFGTGGAAVECDGTATLSCSNLFGNAGGDWVGSLAPLLGSSGNIAADPLFCGAAGEPYAVSLPASPCLPENNACGVLIGRTGGGCGCPAGATLRVPDDQPTIAAALAAAVPGDVVGVCSGVWAETVQLVPGVHLRGARRDLVTITPAGPADAVLVARGVGDSTVVEELTLDGLGIAEQVVLAESTSTALQLRSARITGGAVWGVRNGSDSRVTLGGTLAWANDLFQNGPGGLAHVRNDNVTADSLDAVLNWWGTTRYDSILAAFQGPVRACPITNAEHDASLCAPLSAIAAPETPPTEAGFALSFGPNPFTDRGRIAFTLPRDAAVDLTVHDVAGRRVRLLRSGPLPAGRHEVAWAGRDERGRAVAPGVYFLRLEADGETRLRKVTRLR
jgi:hypothetical protein